MWRLWPIWIVASLVVGCSGLGGPRAASKEPALLTAQGDPFVPAGEPVLQGVRRTLQLWPETGTLSLVGGSARRKGTDPNADFQTPYDPGAEAPFPFLGLGSVLNLPIAPKAALGPCLRMRWFQAEAKGSGGWDVESWSIGARYAFLYTSRLQIHVLADLGAMRWEGEKCAGLVCGTFPEAPIPDDHDGWTAGLAFGADFFPHRWFGLGVQVEYLYFAATDDHDAHWLGASFVFPLRF